jgi:hypothetical protein
MPRKRAASGQTAVKAMRTRVAVAMMRAAILSKLKRSVTNSAVASACCLGMASRRASMSHYAAVCSTKRT